VIDESTWEIPLVFQWLKELGKVEHPEMRKVFNLGIGMILAVSASDASTMIQSTNGIIIGKIKSRSYTTEPTVSFV
jgi:phosphoribosylaminoimidazole (AIR) synthetase